MSTEAQIKSQVESLARGCEHIYTIDELIQRLSGGKRLRVKLGMDPTAPDLTLGHTVVLGKLRQFQDLGHKAVLIIGDYTATIGDPTGRVKTRPVLTPEQVETNARTYLDQAGKVLDLSEDKLEIRHNSEWLAKMNFADVIRLMGQMTVARLLERDTFAERQAQGKEIFSHELLYPLMQARDSVEIESDVELGGTDQTFNNLCGRDLQRNAGQQPQIVMITPLLVGTDGKQKMSKSLGNYVGVTEPPSDMFGKIMRIPDQQMGNYFELLTDLPEAEIVSYLDPATSNPRGAKEKLAKTIITRFHSAQAAEDAAAEFKRVHGGAGGGGLPDEVPEVAVPAAMLRSGKADPVALVCHCAFEESNSAARRLIGERGLRLNGQVVGGLTPLSVKDGDVLQRGKRRFVRLRFE